MRAERLHPKLNKAGPRRSRTGGTAAGGRSGAAGGQDAGPRRRGKPGSGKGVRPGRTGAGQDGPDGPRRPGDAGKAQAGGLVQRFGMRSWCTPASGMNCAQPGHGTPRRVYSRLSALGSRLSLLSALATAGRGPVRPSTCRHHAPRGTAPLHSRGRHPRLRQGHRPSAARRGIGPSPPPGGRAVSRPTRRWCAVTASSVAYPAGKIHRLGLHPRPPSRTAV